jgi:hypothetical protein
MSVCINEAKPCSKVRYEWLDVKGRGFFLTGEFIELDPHGRPHDTSQRRDAPGHARDGDGTRDGSLLRRLEQMSGWKGTR